MKVVVFNPKRCMGCHNCEVYCEAASVGGEPLEVVGRGIGKRRIFVEEVPKGFGVAVSCRHCDDPFCVKVCPTEAMHKEPDGTVRVREERCLGCKACVLACPFGAVEVREGRAVKCELCNGDPACVRACPTKALEFLDVDKVPEEARKLFARRLYETLS